jgi:hypothetical protein
MRSSILLLAHAWIALSCLTAAGCLGGWDDYRVGAGASHGGGGGSGSAQTGGTGAAGGASAERCGGTSLLADDFTTSDTTAPVWELHGATSIASGEAVVIPEANASSYSWNALTSRHFYDLRGDSVSVEITRMVNTASNAYVFFGAWHDDNNSVALAQHSGSLRFTKEVEGVKVDLGTTPYDPAAHRFWRIREDSGTLHWETSADGMDWTTQASSSALFDLSSVQIWLTAEVDPGEADLGEAHFDNLNGGTPKGAWCKTSTLKDDFDDGVMSQSWSLSSFDNECQHAEDGELVLSLPQDGMGGCYYVSANAFDLTDNTLTVKVPVTPSSAPGAYVFLGAFIDGNIERKLEFDLNNGTMVFRQKLDQTVKVINEVPFVPSEQLFWRLRESAGQVFWETSADGQTWKTQAEAPSPFPVTALNVLLGFENEGALPSGAVVRFDKLNLP